MRLLAHPHTTDELEPRGERSLQCVYTRTHEEDKDERMRWGIKGLRCTV